MVKYWKKIKFSFVFLWSLLVETNKDKHAESVLSRTLNYLPQRGKRKIFHEKIFPTITAYKNNLKIKNKH
jgi:hypothetical protein